MINPDDRFARCLAVVLDHEGGDAITDDPRDPGGLTKWGISQGAFPHVDIRDLTREQAADIYRRHYWMPVQGDYLPVGIDLCLFAGAVNLGVTGAIRCLQAAVGALVDGEFGPKTMAALMRMKPLDAIALNQSAQIDRYIKLGGFQTFGRGWVIRAVSVAVTATSWRMEV